MGLIPVLPGLNGPATLPVPINGPINPGTLPNLTPGISPASNNQPSIAPVNPTGPNFSIQPITPGSIGQAIGQGVQNAVNAAGQAAGNATQSITGNSSLNDLFDPTGIARDSFVLYAFLGIVLILVYVFVSGNSPVQLVSDTTKTAKTVAKYAEVLG